MLLRLAPAFHVSGKRSGSGAAERGLAIANFAAKSLS
jgi:hypothetical protein